MEKTVDKYTAALAGVMAEVKRVLRDDGLLFLNLGDTYYSGKGQPRGPDRKHRGRRLNRLRVVDASGLGVAQKTLLGMPWRVALKMVDEHDWVLRSPIVWHREKPLPEANVQDRPWKTYEFVFLFAKSRKYRFNRATLRSHKVEDVWPLNARPKTGRAHPAMFPPELVERCLRLGNPGKGAVLDPFSGSGTVLEVASELGMSAVGIDLNQNFCRNAAKRLGLRKSAL